MASLIAEVIGYWEGLYRGSSAEYKAWYLVPLLVLLALGATVLLGALAWCMMHGQNLGFVVNVGAGKYGVMCVSR